MIRWWPMSIPGNFRQEGFQVDVAADGRAGLKRFSVGGSIWWLLDLLLPGVDGVEVLKQIRTKCSPRTLSRACFYHAYLGGAVQQGLGGGCKPGNSEGGVTPNRSSKMVKNALEDPPPAAVPLTKGEGGSPSLTPRCEKNSLLSSPKDVRGALAPPETTGLCQGYHPDNQTCLREMFRVVATAHGNGGHCWDWTGSRRCPRPWKHCSRNCVMPLSGLSPSVCADHSAGHRHLERFCLRILAVVPPKVLPRRAFWLWMMMSSRGGPSAAPWARVNLKGNLRGQSGEAP